MKLSEILNLKYNMAKYGLCSIVEAGKLEFHKVLMYQELILGDKQG